MSGLYQTEQRLGGGEGGIRTHGTRKGTTVFETAPFDHSGTSPRLGIARGARKLVIRPLMCKREIASGARRARSLCGTHLAGLTLTGRTIIRSAPLRAIGPRCF